MWLCAMINVFATKSKKALQKAEFIMNGVQEASSSNLDTRTKKPWNSLSSTVFF